MGTLFSGIMSLASKKKGGKKGGGNMGGGQKSMTNSNFDGGELHIDSKSGAFTVNKGVSQGTLQTAMYIGGVVSLLGLFMYFKK